MLWRLPWCGTGMNDNGMMPKLLTVVTLWSAAASRAGDAGIGGEQQPGIADPQ